MSVDDFKDLEDILRHFGLRFQFNQFIDLKNPPKIELAPFLLEDLEFGLTHWGTDDKEAFICEFLIVPILKEVWKRHPDLNLFSHVPIQADELKLIPDYLVSAKTRTGWKRLHSPLLLVVEAKDEKFEAGWFQALLQLVICQKINGMNEIPILAIVTTGDLWQFGKLEKECFVRHPIPLSIRKPEDLLGILDICFAECEKNARLYSDDEGQRGK